MDVNCRIYEAIEFEENEPIYLLPVPGVEVVELLDTPGEEAPPDVYCKMYEATEIVGKQPICLSPVTDADAEALDMVSISDKDDESVHDVSPIPVVKSIAETFSTSSVPAVHTTGNYFDISYCILLRFFEKTKTVEGGFLARAEPHWDITGMDSANCLAGENMTECNATLKVPRGQQVPVKSRLDRRHCCIYCKKLVVKLNRHLEVIHPNEADVLEMCSLDKGAC